MEGSELVTLVIHTPERAHALRQILELHGIPVRLTEIEDEGALLLKAVKVEVAKENLPLSVNILESTEPYSPGKVELKLSGMSRNLLIPVDFSDYSHVAVEVGFELAKRLSLHPLILHTFVGNTFYLRNSAASVYTDLQGSDMDYLEEAEAEKTIREQVEKEFSNFVREVRQFRKEGKYADVRFSTMLREGVPEEVIAEYCRESKPALIVMATRGKSKKEKQTIGSVTAEVIDTCRVPVFTVPECYKFPGVANIQRLGFFANLDRNDLFTMDSLMRMFSYPQVHITLFPVDEKQTRTEDKLKSEKAYYSEAYKASTFSYENIGPKNFRKDLEEYLTKNPIELFVVPNKKSNVFSRLFRPGIAHRMLFERDIPMLVIPI